MTRRVGALALTFVALLATALAFRTAPASADGDPGSDVLVYQSLFLAADAGVSVAQQAQLGDLLTRAERAGFPVRVAIIASPSDLGAITGLWRQPRSYARFLGIELSATYRGRLLVVMPNGFGFNWPGHSSAAAYRTLGHVSISRGGKGLASSVGAAVKSLAVAAGVRLSAATEASRPSPSSTPPTAPASPGSNTDSVVAAVAAGLLAAAALALLARRLFGRRRLPRVRLPFRARAPRPPVALGAALALAAVAAITVTVLVGPSGAGQSEALAANPSLDPGTRLSGQAPGFTLTDQFGQPVSLGSFRGKAVLLAFNDSECTTICPLTTTAMLDAKAMLGAAGRRVELLGVDANPKATSLEDVLSYSQLHGMLHAWHFLTGSLSQLKQVWKAYHIEAAIQGGEIAHTPALFVIDPRGKLSRLFVTQQSYAAVGQLGQLLAEATSQVLPGHPAVHSHYSYSRITGIGPTSAVTLPRAGGGSVQLAPGRPRVLLFFATWDQQVLSLAGGLEGLGRYDTAARRARLPALTAIDEGSVEPPGALTHFLGGLPHPLSYPVAIDGGGQVADGYEVQGLPWLMVVTGSGRIAWYYAVAALGWPKTGQLIARVREALARAAGPTSSGAALAQLKGSPPALTALHKQASQLLGGEPALAARIRALRGYPIVINAWASWCVPCRSEFGLLASAAARYGRHVAFLGADTGDSSGDAHYFLIQHPVSYPSYQIAPTDLDWLVPQGLAGLPTTIFVSPRGKLLYVHNGVYDSQGTLDADVQSYALGG